MENENKSEESNLGQVTRNPSRENKNTGKGSASDQSNQFGNKDATLERGQSSSQGGQGSQQEQGRSNKDISKDNSKLQ